MDNKTIQRPFYSSLPDGKIKINWNKNPIRMDLFLSFLQVEVTRSTDHLGYCTGWTLLTNEDRKLLIGGGIVDGIEWLNSLQYGKNLSNPYNNYVNPFYLFEILSKEGRQFFLDYYKDEIDKMVSNRKENIEHLEDRILRSKEELKDILLQIETLTNQTYQQ